MDNARDLAQGLIAQIRKLVDDARVAVGDPDTLTEAAQLREMERAIGSLKEQNLGVPEVILQLQSSLAAKTSEARDAADALSYIQMELGSLLSELRSFSNGEVQGKRGRGRKQPPAEGMPQPGTKPAMLCIGDTKVPVRKWRDVIVATAEWLLEQGHELPSPANWRKRLFLGTDDGEMHSPARLTSGIFIETHYSSTDCVRAARWLFLECGLSPEAISVQADQAASATGDERCAY